MSRLRFFLARGEGLGLFSGCGGVTIFSCLFFALFLITPDQRGVGALGAGGSGGDGVGKSC